MGIECACLQCRICNPAKLAWLLDPEGYPERGARDPSTTEAKHEMDSRLLLDVVVVQSTPVLELLARKDQTLLIRRNTCDNKDQNTQRVSYILKQSIT